MRRAPSSKVPKEPLKILMQICLFFGGGEGGDYCSFIWRQNLSYLAFIGLTVILKKNIMSQE